VCLGFSPLVDAKGSKSADPGAACARKPPNHFKVGLRRLGDFGADIYRATVDLSKLYDVELMGSHVVPLRRGAILDIIDTLLHHNASI
jgi:hypothetical protein